ncbi:MAG: Gmad2 immunoglobulin-like domain-containing protein [Terricaulis sp.]
MRLMLTSAAFATALAFGLAACSPAPTTTAQQPTPVQAAIAPADLNLASVTTPMAGAQSKSPLIVTGIAPNNWYFEASFPVRVIDLNNQVLAEGPAQAQSDWTVQGPVQFKAELNFLVLTETHATLVLQEDMPGENKPAPREVRIPVILEPGH